MPTQQFEKITARGVKGMFYMALEQGPHAWVNKLAMKTSSDQDSEEYGWLGMTPALREWIGGREGQELRENSFTISNKDYESTLRVKDKDMRRDKTEQLRRRIADLSSRVNAHPAKLLSTQILNGASSVCYDGQYFFDTDHAEGDSGTQSNKLTPAANTATAPTVAEYRDAILGGVAAMYGFKDDRGEPLNEGATEFIAMVPVPHMASALSATILPNVDNGNSNVLNAQDNFKISVVTNPRLTWTDTFALFRADEGAAPFILQEEQEAFLDHLGEGSDHFFKNKEHLFSAEWSGNTGFGFWQHAAQLTFT